MAAKIVHDHQVARLERGEERLFDVGLEGGCVDGAVKHPRRLDPVVAKGGDEGHGFPVAVRNLGCQPSAARRPSAQRLHVGPGPRLVDEDQALRSNPVLPFLPPHSSTRDVRSIAFAGHHAFF